MIKEDYVSFETAKLLKEKGFHEMTCGLYDCGNGRLSFMPEIEWNSKKDCPFISAPTLQMAMKWLRSNQFEVIVKSETDYDEDERGTKYYHTPIWYFNVYRIYDSTQMSDDARYFATFEEACEAGIKYCLENLI